MSLVRPATWVLICSLWCTQLGLSAADRHPKDVLKKNWTSLKLWFTVWDGDFYGTGPTVMLQRLPDKRIQLSYAELGNGEGKEPKLARHVTEAEFAQIVEEADAIWQKAQSDPPSDGERILKLPMKEKLEILAKPHGDLSICTMHLKFSASDPTERCEFEKVVTTSSGAWLKLLTKVSGAAPR